MNSERWTLLGEHFDAALALPRGERAAFIERATADDPDLRVELESLLAASDAAPGFLERPAEMSSSALATGDSLEPSQRIGVWRIKRLIGRGGMGEVYEVERSDGQFEQRAALKLTRHDAAKFLDRFNAERQILARLDHPGIARLLDGGITPDGRPYAVMEFVEGEVITRYCDLVGAGLSERLMLFLQVCDAVSHAHGHLIVHRDIKPGNVLVGRDGRARLLDFGIAKPLDNATTGSEMTAALLTPDYAAPEQLTGEPVTTATDVYALGILLFELLTGSRPRTTSGQPLAQMVSSVLDTPVPLASAMAERAAHATVAPRALKGDLDAIIGKCLRRESDLRYVTVNALKLDIERSLRGDPVQARADTGWYVFGRLVRRYRWAVAAVGTIFLLLAAGIVLTTWQAGRATREAKRAAVTRDFLISVFRESDPRIARNREPGETTAKELLDQSVTRIASEFADDPETQLQLLGLVSEIYGFWGDEGERFLSLLEQRKELARKHFGPTHPVFIESVLVDAWASIYPQDYVEAQRLLDEADRLIRDGGHDDSLLRAQWWLAKAEALSMGSRAERMAALDNAVDLYAKLAPQNADYAVALANSASLHFAREDYAGATERYQRAIAVFVESKDRNDADLANTWANLARSLQNLGEFDAAERAYQQFAALYRRMHSLENSAATYWRFSAEHARFVHMRGDRERAQGMFAEILNLIPPNWTTTTHDVIARELYAERLAAEGRAAEAVPFLETAEQTYIERPLREYDLRRVRQTLGDAYDRVGRSDEARRALAAARAESMEKDDADSIAVLGVRERWARFLLDHADAAGASAELAEIVRAGGDRAIAPLALAHSDLARLAIHRKDGPEALEQSRIALATLEKVKGLYDVRIGPAIWRIHANALALTGDTQGAATWNLKALEASRRYDGAATPGLTRSASGAAL